MLHIYNTLTRSKQLFTPIDANHVRMYVCGMTVYDYCHLGHARVMVAFDMVARWLKQSGYQVTYVRNITDIDDKIIARAAENGESMRELTDRFIAAMHEDADALGIERPTHEPRATEYVPQMLNMIDTLQQNGLAYQADDGDVNYAVRQFAGYGKLSGKSLDELQAGERVAVVSSKRDPLDFVLWKSAKEHEPADSKWPSNYGVGRPGWHIECSAMSHALLGASFDIHGGGADLQFPHHENEIAQSQGCGHGFANYWMHNGFIRVDNEKMSKSLGNFFTIRDVLARYDAEVVRFFILRAQYRSPLNYSDAHLDDAKNALTRLYTALRDYDDVVVAVDWDNAFAQRFKAAMDDDFNSAQAIAVLFELAHELNKASRNETMAGLLKGLGQVLGLFARNACEYLKTGGVVQAQGSMSDAQIEALVQERVAAKANKDYARADEIRKQLDGIVHINDIAGGQSTWSRI